MLSTNENNLITHFFEAYNDEHGHESHHIFEKQR
jgi:hypothetical protein